jgi:hypothetical protein
MKLLSTLDVRLPAPEVRIEPMDEEYSLTDEETAYNKIIAINPNMEHLVRDLDLVSTRTGQQIRVVRRMYQLSLVETVTPPQLLALARKILCIKETYTKKEVVKRLMDMAQVSHDRAKTGANLLIKAGVLQGTKGGKYCLPCFTVSKYPYVCHQ